MSHQHNASEAGTLLLAEAETDQARQYVIDNVGPQMWADMTRWERSNELAVALRLIRLHRRGMVSIQADAKLQPIA